MAIRRFTPYQPPEPPAGSYDPALDAQIGASERGLSDLERDIQTAGLRAQDDYGLATTQANTQFGWQGQDLLTGRNRNLADLGQNYSRGRADLQLGYGRNREDLQTGYSRNRSDLTRGYQRNSADLTRGFERGRSDLQTARTQADEDYRRNVGMLSRSYNRLGDQQRQSANAAGVLQGGALLQAAAKRAGNEAVEREPIDTGFRRFTEANTQAGQRLAEDVSQQSNRLSEDYSQNTGRLDEDFSRTGSRLDEDFGRSTGRLDEDYGTQAGRVNEDYATQSARGAQAHDWDLGQLGLGFQRGATDRTTQLTRAQREGQAFGLDVGAQRAYQAAGTGWAPPQRGEPGGMPANEFVNAAGRHYRVINGVRYDQYGRRLGRATGRAF